MRDQFLLRPFGKIPGRNFLLLFAAVIVAAFAYLVALAPTAHAATDLTWKDGEIVYQSHTYIPKDDIKAGSSTDLPEGTKVFTYFTQPAAGSIAQKAQIIYFSPGSDPTTAETAHYVVYDFTPPDSYSHPTGKKDVTATPLSGSEQDKQSSSCNIDGGLGWIICPLTTTLSKGMDDIFNILTQFLEVQPISTDQTSVMFRAWSMMRNIANVAFVIAFLVVIYSQISNIGLSNYGLKRILPRLILAAILVNLSYWICAIGVDLSNIFGHSIQGMFNAIRDNLVGADGTNWNLNWTDLSSALLGGTAAIGLLIGAHTFAAAAGGTVIMLLPILMGVILSALVALIVLAARQALITIMIIIAPLAFVAFLLPNTEKYFKKWQELFTTMLIVFPAFAVVFSGAQLAGDIIIQNAVGGGSLILLLLGMTVKVAPVAITPLLVKVSGSVGRLAGMTNNRAKGLVDRTRNMAQDRSEAYTAKARASKKAGFLGINNRARGIDSKKRDREGMKKAHESRTEANWAKSRGYQKIHHYDANSQLIKEAGEANAARHTAIAQATNSVDKDYVTTARLAKLKLDASQAVVEANWDEIKTGNARSMVAPEGLSVSALANYAHARHAEAQEAVAAAVNTAVETHRQQSAQNMQQGNLSQALQDSPALRQRAGGIDPNGAQRALADALKKKQEIRGEAVKTANAIIDNANVSNDNLVTLATGKNELKVRVAGAQGVTITEEIQEAAMKRIAGGGNIKAMQDMLDRIDVAGLTENHRVALSDTLTNNSKRPKYVTATAAAKIGQNDLALGETGVNNLIREAVKAQKYSAETLLGQDDYTLQRILKDITSNHGSYDTAGLAELRKQIEEINSTPLLAAKLGERKKTLNQMLTWL